MPIRPPNEVSYTIAQLLDAVTVISLLTLVGMLLIDGAVPVHMLFNAGYTCGLNALYCTLNQG